MKITDFQKDLKITTNDIEYIKPFFFKDWNYDPDYIPALGKEAGYFDNLVFDKFDRETFFKMQFVANRVLQRVKDKKAFEIALKLAYYLIDIGEKQLPDDLIEVNVAKLYEMLGYIIYSKKEFEIYPFNFQRNNFDIDIDNDLAVSYCEKSYIMNPAADWVAYFLGKNYFIDKYYVRSFEFLKKASDGDYYDEPDILSQLGTIFDEKAKVPQGEILYDLAAIECFKLAYELAKRNKEVDRSRMIYNMAYLDFTGLGMKSYVYKEKGMKHLAELDKYLAKKGEDIFKYDDSYGIIKKYYKK